MPRGSKRPRRPHRPQQTLPYGTACPHPCPVCGGVLSLRPSRFGVFYGCENFPACRGSHGAHANGQPLGVPATKEVKLLRQEVHRMFDPIWNSPEARLHRSAAYQWLASLMGISLEECHVGMFDKERCEQALKLLKEHRP